jgi:hypothetical protein
MKYRIVSLATGDSLEADGVVSLFHKVGGQLALDPQWTPDVHVKLWELFEAVLPIGVTPLGPDHQLVVEE